MVLAMRSGMQQVQRGYQLVMQQLQQAGSVHTDMLTALVSS